MATTMQRFNAGKAPMTLVPSSLIRVLSPQDQVHKMQTALVTDVAHVLGFGAKKYSPNNWRKSGSWLQVADCALRHLNKIIAGESHDTESGIHHLAHAACNIAFLLEFIDQGSGEDDRHRVSYFSRIVIPKSDRLQFDLAYHFLLRWKDGADHTCLGNAARSLASYYEALDPEEREFIPGTHPNAPIKVTIN